MPEAPVTEEKFLADVDAVYRKHGRCLIAVSEGVSRPDGKTWAEALANAEEVLDSTRKGDIVVTPEKAAELSRPKGEAKGEVKAEAKAEQVRRETRGMKSISSLFGSFKCKSK